MGDEQETVARAEQRLNEILATTLDEVAQAEELERERAHKVSVPLVWRSTQEATA